MIERAKTPATSDQDAAAAPTAPASPGSLAARVEAAYRETVERLLSERDPCGSWPGRLSDSALSTATAVSALSVVSRSLHAAKIDAGVAWLMANQNSDGGWGDTTDSPSNLATTMLTQAALTLAGPDERSSAALARAEAWLTERAGPTMADRARAVSGFYGKDRTFAVPILTNCALAGLAEWPTIPRLPFELARLSHRWLRRLHIHVVSYALPALIAIGQLLHTKRPTRNPLLRLLRDRSVAPTLRRLIAIQPSSGGFIEAIPLTSFVVMSLAAAGRADHPVAVRGLEFLLRAARDDGAWPIDTNLAMWLTTLSVNALRSGPAGRETNLAASLDWVVRGQCRQVHPFTDAPPGGWPWTDLPGGVPDADDTAGALLALAGYESPEAVESGRLGIHWLINLQNDDGGWPTFCRGWGKLPFDRSGADLTAHALRALNAWAERLPDLPCRDAVARGLDYLRRSQRDDGSWTALWFGNQAAGDTENPVFATARVLAAYRDLDMGDAEAARRGVAYLVSARGREGDGSGRGGWGGWGGQDGLLATVEETAAAVDALCAWVSQAEVAEAVRGGCEFLVRRLEAGGLDEAAPIGLYFTRLWYSERVYPIIFTVAALGRVLSRRNVLT